MKLGIIIPVYNRSRTILTTLESLKAQTVLPDLVVVVDDGSTDGTMESVSNWSQTSGVSLPLKILRVGHGGAGQARNAGWALLSDCDLVSFLDSDDCWPSDMVESAKRVLSAHTVGVADSVILQHRMKTQKRFGKSIAEDPFRMLTGGLQDPGILSSLVLGYDVADRCMPFRPDIPTGQDMPFLLSLTCHGEWKPLPAKTVQQRRDDFKPGEESNLSNKYFDREVLWARAFSLSWHITKAQLSNRDRKLLCACLKYRWARAAAFQRKNGQNLHAMISKIRSIIFGVRGHYHTLIHKV